jgi:hypothetical protein
MSNVRGIHEGNDPNVNVALGHVEDEVRVGGINGIAIVLTHHNGTVTRIVSDTLGDATRLIAGLEMIKHEIIREFEL